MSMKYTIILIMTGEKKIKWCRPMSYEICYCAAVNDNYNILRKLHVLRMHKIVNFNNLFEPNNNNMPRKVRLKKKKKNISQLLARIESHRPPRSDQEGSGIEKFGPDLPFDSSLSLQARYHVCNLHRRAQIEAERESGRGVREKGSRGKRRGKDGRVRFYTRR